MKDELQPQRVVTMTDHPVHRREEIPPETQRYLGYRLDGARDLYLLALALGERTRTRKERPRSAA